LSASIGVAMVPTGAVIDEIMSLADEALATAKASGKNQTVVFRPDSTGSAQARNVWPSRIKAAAVQGNLVLHYQPIVRLDDNGVEYSEAFLRMKGTKDRLLYPSEFLPHAYRFGLTPELDLWVTRSVLHRMAVNRGLRVAVNLSGQTLQDREVLSSIERAVAERRPRPGDLTFEISESTAVQDLHRMNDWIQRMKQLGCRFALDDFGTGASSFEHLRSLSVDTVKIDGSYIRTLLSDPSCLAFVDAINSLCSSLGMVTVAECVETPAVAEMLARIGVRFGQGYLWGRPTAIDGLRM
ncbi:MAG TPA: GGDEF domain-containing phosphodiesterase, partial [Symbiobacteriaceae bacterium]|nr:GGDEF domain-containing phosphodiesterase [Symbiobacteriaceae bacterium]